MPCELRHFTEHIDLLVEMDATSMLIKNPGALRMEHGVSRNAISPTWSTPRMTTVPPLILAGDPQEVPAKISGVPAMASGRIR